MAAAVVDGWAPVLNAASSPDASAQQTPSGAQQKKPRHRHTPEQLAALNELFAKNEHPSLEERTALAERLGMSTKAITSWMQNRRATFKKRARTMANDAANASQPPVSIPAPAPLPASALPPKLGETDNPHHSPMQRVSHINDHPPSSSFFSADHSQFASPTASPDPTSMNRKMRIRPTAEQTEELKRLYNLNPNPTSEERQALADRIGMRYQSVSNWLQRQRSLAKTRKEDEHTDASSSNSKADYPHSGDMRQYSAFPPRPPQQNHRSVLNSDNIPPSQSHAQVSPHSSPMRHRSPSVSPSMDDPYPRRASMRRSTTPYVGPMQSRPRRSRPEPYQLDALKSLFTRTATPTIEERSSLAQEIGIPLDKVTHWFRNSRAAQRRKQPGSGDEDDNDKQDIEGVSPQYSAAVSRSASRAGTPSLSIRSSSSSSSMMVMPKEQCREVQMRDMQHSNMPSEDDEYPEAITPENGQSPSPGPDVNRRPRSSALPDSQPPPHMLLGAPEPYPPQASYRPQFYPRPPLPYPAHFEHTLRVGTPSSKQSGHSSYDSRVPPGQFDAAIAIVSPYHSKPHPHLDEDPMSCAETAKRIGISLEDAYLLLDFHRQ